MRSMRLLLGPDTMRARVRSLEQARAQTVDACAALEEETDSVAGLLLEGVVLRLRADLAWLEACERCWTSRKEG